MAPISTEKLRSAGAASRPRAARSSRFPWWFSQYRRGRIAGRFFAPPCPGRRSLRTRVVSINSIVVSAADVRGRGRVRRYRAFGAVRGDEWQKSYFLTDQPTTNRVRHDRLCGAGVRGRASAQSDIVLQASNASVKAGRWSVASDSTAGGKKMRHADGGDQADERRGQPQELLRAHVHGHRGRAVSALAARPRRRRRRGPTIRSSCSSPGSVNASGERGLPHRHDRGDRGQPRGVQGMRLQTAGSGRTTAGARACRARDLFRDDRHPEHPRADPGRRDLDRSDRPVALDLPREAAVRHHRGDLRQTGDRGAPTSRPAAQGAGLEHPSRRRHRRRLQHQPHRRPDRRRPAPTWCR